MYILSADKVFCFYTAGSKYLNVKVTDLNPTMCTHLVYQYAHLLPYAAISTSDLDVDELRQFVNLRSGTSSSLKILVSVGGPMQESSTLSTIMSIVSLRKAAVKSIVGLINNHALDGIDFYWQYPVMKGGKPEDRVNFVAFLSLLKDELKAGGKLLTISVAPTKDFFLSSYNVPAIAPYVDFVNVMAFDLRAYWNANTGFNAPTYPAKYEPNDVEKQLNVDAILNGWINAGLSNNKLVLGVTTEGHSFRLANTSKTGLRALTVGYGIGDNGVLNYQEVCKLLGTGEWRIEWDSVQHAHYAYKGDQWISYESIASIEAKIKLAKQLQVAGIGLWTMHGDDVKNVCGGGKFTLLRYVSEGLGLNVKEEEALPEIPMTTTKAPTATAPTTTAPTTPAPTTTSSTTPANTGFPDICPSNGFVRDPNDCAKYYRCNRLAPFAILSVHICTNGLYFDSKLSTCNWKAFVQC